MEDGSKQYLSTGECAALKGVSRQAIHNAIKRGDLAAVKIGPNWAIRANDCASYQVMDVRRDTGKQAGKARWNTISEGDKSEAEA